ncbi:MAG: FKBP-type peptidyl-prolyl cis-trans isomerase [Bacteroidales bacterium]
MKYNCTKYYILFSIIILGLFIIASCNNQVGDTIQKKKTGIKELEGVNSYLVQKDRERIQNYIERKSLVMKESPSGLWYCIINEGEGKFFGDNDRIIMEYNCSLLDGTKCYSSNDTGPKSIVLGKSIIEAGLLEGLKLLKPGGEALFIIPPYLAWGIPGDGKAIPSRAILVYEIKILNK